MDEEGELRQVSQLLQHDQQQSCGAFFNDRGIYYLIKLDSKSRDHITGCYVLLPGTDSKVKYVSLLNNMTDSYPLLAGMPVQ